MVLGTTGVLAGRTFETKKAAKSDAAQRAVKIPTQEETMSKKKAYGSSCLYMK
jgi:hypothetical protein